MSWTKDFKAMNQRLAKSSFQVRCEHALKSLKCTQCPACDAGKKESGRSFCLDCFKKLSEHARRGLYFHGVGYVKSFWQGMRELNRVNVTGESYFHNLY